MPVSSPEVVRSEVTVPLTSFIQPYHSHYFSGQIDRPHFQQRDYSFPGIPELMPLARLFLDTCAADCSDDYRYLFTLLGSELAANAIRHSRSGLPGGFYDLQVRRSVQGMHVTCRAWAGDGRCPRDHLGGQRAARGPKRLVLPRAGPGRQPLVPALTWVFRT